MQRHLLVAVVAVATLAGCAAPPHKSVAPRPAPPIASSPRPLGPAPQTAWMHGLGVDVPMPWPRDQLRCGTPFRTTLVVAPSSFAIPACLWLAPKNLRRDVVWIGGYFAPLPAGAGLGTVDLPPGGLAAMTPATISGEPARIYETRDRLTDQPATLVVLPGRLAYVEISIRSATLRKHVLDSIRTTATDPATGCATHSTAYDKAPQHPTLDRHLDVSGATTVTGCHYVGGWLEQTAASVPEPKLRALIRAIDGAPPTTERRAPGDVGCNNVAPIDDGSNGPIVLRFGFAGGTTKLVVGRILWCSRWQSYLYSGNVMRRMPGAFLTALPNIVDSYPDPASM